MEWDVRTVAEHFCQGDHTQRVPDQRIIPECNRRQFIWVTAGEESQKDHAEAIWRHRIHVLWIHRPGGIMKRDYQLGAVATAIGAFDCRLDMAPLTGLWCELRDLLTDRLAMLGRVHNGRTWRIGVVAGPVQSLA